MVGVSEQPGRYQRSANGLVGAMLLLVLLVGGYAGVQALGRDHVAQPVQTVDYAPVVAEARAAGKLYVLAPDPMPGGWRATSVSYQPGRSPTWHLGMLTDTGKYVGIEESLASEHDLVTTYVDAAATRGRTVSLRGRTWRVWTDSGGDYALVLVTRKETVLVGGSGGEHAVRRLVQVLSFGNLAG
jgi:hypothetical protein